tara:strand:+ start:990 stop:2783 length:1794 start_codon:yes stop_codon:yes gene_type:complete
MGEKQQNTKNSVSGKAFDWSILSKVIHYARPYKWQTIISLFLSVALGLLATARPILIRNGVDYALVKGGDIVSLWYTMIILFSALLLEAIGQFVFIYFTNDLGARVIKDIRIKLFDHLLDFRIPFFDKTPIGTLVTRTVSDVETMAEIFSNGILVIFGDLFKIVVMITTMFVLFDSSLVAISLSVIPLLFIATRWFQQNIKLVFTDVRNQVAALNSFVQERISGMSVVQLFTRERSESKRFREINAKHRDANIRGIWYFSLFLPIIDMLSSVSIALAIWFGGLKASMGGDVSVGDLTALIVFINLLYRPLRQLADRFNTLQMGMVASERVLKLVNDTDEKEISGKHHQNRVSGDVEIKNLSFAYSKKEWILEDINVKISSGQTYALVGATGSGKSTLVHLLLGYYQVQKGSVSLDGMDLKKWSLNSLRKNVSLVQQDVFLFSDSVRNNVTVYRDVKDEDIWKAAEDMGIKDFISSLPGGLDYDVKERGGMLSTGQRQLLAFLRAYLNNPSFLVLDEATSSIDSQAEKWIQRATKTLTKGRTSIVVAHRLATVVNADHIIVLDKGKIVEEGTHKSLLKRSGYYQNLFNKQYFDSKDSI